MCEYDDGVGFLYGLFGVFWFFGDGVEFFCRGVKCFYVVGVMVDGVEEFCDGFEVVGGLICCVLVVDGVLKGEVWDEVVV